MEPHPVRISALQWAFKSGKLLLIGLALAITQATALAVIRDGSLLVVVSNAVQLAVGILVTTACYQAARRAGRFGRLFWTLAGAGFCIWCVGQVVESLSSWIQYPSIQGSVSAKIFFKAWTAPLILCLFLDPDARPERSGWPRKLDFLQAAIFVLVTYLYLGTLASERYVPDEWWLATAVDGLISGGCLIRAAASGKGTPRVLFRRFGYFRLAAFVTDILLIRAPRLTAYSWFDLVWTGTLLIPLAIASSWTNVELSQEGGQGSLRSRPLLVAKILPLIFPTLVLAMGMRIVGHHQAIAVGGVSASFAVFYLRLRTAEKEQQRSHEALWQNELLQMIATGLPLPEFLHRLVEIIETQSVALASVLLVDPDGAHLHLAAAPSLPAEYNAAVEGIPIGEGIGSCGTAAYRRKPVIVSDIASDPLWSEFQHLALKHDLRACWSSPILSTHGQVLGTFAIYYREVRRPMAHDLELIGVASRLASIAIERKLSEDALRRSEGDFRSLVENAPYAIYRTNLEHDRFLKGNPTLVSMLGYASEQEVLELSLSRDVFCDPEVPQRLLREVAISDKFVLLADWKRKDGSVRKVSITGRVLHNSPTEEPFFESYAEDITERQLLEQRLRQAQKMEAVGQLAGGVAHDFNNLLGVILVGSDLLLEAQSQSDVQLIRKRVQEIRNAAERGASLTRQLLAFGRKQVRQPEILNLNLVLSHMGQLLRRIIGEDIEFILLPEADLRSIQADRSQLEQILLNLAVNSRDAMPSGGTLRIRTRNAELDEAFCRQHAGARPGLYVMLSVEDTGCGMDAKIMAHIFEPFFTTKGLGKGTGLGLSTVYGIVKQNEGFIWVTSKVGQGTTVDVYLPTTESRASQDLDSRTVAKVKGSETVLVVEDQADFCELSAEILKNLGYNVLSANDGHEALRVAQKHAEPIDLLITDVVMPGMSGQQLATALLRARPALKILYTSGYTHGVIAQHGILEPGLSFLQKPFTAAELGRRVRETIDHKTPASKGAAASDS